MFGVTPYFGSHASTLGKLQHGLVHSERTCYAACPKYFSNILNKHQILKATWLKSTLFQNQKFYKKIKKCQICETLVESTAAVAASSCVCWQSVNMSGAQEWEIVSDHPVRDADLNFWTPGNTTRQHTHTNTSRCRIFKITKVWTSHPDLKITKHVTLQVSFGFENQKKYNFLSLKNLHNQEWKEKWWLVYNMVLWAWLLVWSIQHLAKVTESTSVWSALHISQTNQVSWHTQADIRSVVCGVYKFTAQ